MIQNARLLILDEATSAVDTRTERIVQAAIGYQFHHAADGLCEAYAKKHGQVQ